MNIGRVLDEEERKRGHTSPPPTTRTFFPLICHARMRLPPGWTSGNFLAIVKAEFRELLVSPVGRKGGWNIDGWTLGLFWGILGRGLR